MGVSRRSFLKTMLGATAALSLPTWMVPYSSAQTARGVKEFKFSASRTKVNLGTGADFLAVNNGMLSLIKD